MVKSPKSTDWVREGQNKARVLRASAKSAAAEMFKSGDLSDFLEIMSRLHGYDACNLLLILQQNPKATFLAGYNAWKNLLGNSKAKVLKPEWWGKGIDLLIPFTEHRDKKDLRLTWFVGKQYDIGQTNVKTYEIPASVYVLDELHEKNLIEGACNALRSEYHLSVSYSNVDAEADALNLPGRLTDKIVFLRQNFNDRARLEWLIECLCTLQDGASALPSACHDLFFLCIRRALWQTWSLENPPSLYPQKQKIRNMSDDLQMDFLDTLQRTYRSIEESIAAGYVAVREEIENAKDLQDFDNEILSKDIRPYG